MKKQNSLTQVITTSYVCDVILDMLGISSTFNHDDMQDPYFSGTIDSDDTDLLVELMETIVKESDSPTTKLIITDLDNGLTKFEIHFEGGYYVDKDAKETIETIKDISLMQLIAAQAKNL